MSLTTSKTIYRAGYQPLMPGVFVAPYPYAYRYGWDDEADQPLVPGRAGAPAEHPDRARRRRLPS